MEGIRGAIFELVLALFLLVILVLALIFELTALARRGLLAHGQSLGVIARSSLAAVLVMWLTA